MGNELRWQSWIFDMFILYRIDRELHSLICLDLKNLAYKVQNFLDFFGKIPVRILLDVFLCVQVF